MTFLHRKVTLAVPWKYPVEERPFFCFSMIEIVASSPSRIELHASGTISQDDLERVIPILEAHHTATPETNYLLLLENLHGVEPAAFWDDLKFVWKHHDRFARSAVVGDEAWQEQAVRWGKGFLPGEVRFYPAHQLISARNWVSQGRHSGASKES